MVPPDLGPTRVGPGPEPGPPYGGGGGPPRISERTHAGRKGKVGGITRPYPLLKCIYTFLPAWVRSGIHPRHGTPPTWARLGSPPSDPPWGGGPNFGWVGPGRTPPPGGGSPVPVGIFFFGAEGAEEKNFLLKMAKKKAKNHKIGEITPNLEHQKVVREKALKIGLIFAVFKILRPRTRT